MSEGWELNWTSGKMNQTSQQNSGGSILSALKFKMNTLREEVDNLKDEKEELKRELADRDERLYKVRLRGKLSTQFLLSTVNKSW